MAKKKTKQPLKKVNRTVEGLNQLIAGDKIPQCFVDTYKQSVVMGMLFVDYPLGEICGNIAHQVNKVFTRYEFGADVFNEEIKMIYAEYMKAFASKLKEKVEKLQTEQVKEKESG